MDTIQKPAPTCSTCRFGQPSPPSPRMPRACRHPRMEYLRDPVNGWLPTCSEARGGDFISVDLCGANGRLWEAQPEAPRRAPLLIRIWRLVRGGEA